MSNYEITEHFKEYHFSGLSVKRYPLWLKVVITCVILPLFTVLIGMLLIIILGLEGSTESKYLFASGCLAFLVGLPLVGSFRKLPERLLFDPEGQQLIILEHASTPVEAAPALSYETLHNLSIRQQVKGDKNHSTVHFQLSIFKRDLSHWPLMSFPSEDDAYAVRDRVLNLMGWLPENPDSSKLYLEDKQPPPLTDEYSYQSGWSLSQSHTDQSSQTGSFDVDRQPEEVSIKWKKNNSLKRRFGLNLLITGGLMICLGGLDMQGGATFIGLLFGIISVLIIRGRLRSKTQGYVKITSSETILEPINQLFGTSEERVVSNEDLVSVGLSFDQHTGLVFLRRREFNRLIPLYDRADRLGLSDLMEIFYIYKELIRLDGSHLSITELIRLECLIEEEFARLTERSLR